MKALTKTDFNFPGQKSVYHGKVRDVYNINGEKLVRLQLNSSMPLLTSVRTGNWLLQTPWLPLEYCAKVFR